MSFEECSPEVTKVLRHQKSVLLLWASKPNNYKTSLIIQTKQFLFWIIKPNQRIVCFLDKHVGSNYNNRYIPIGFNVVSHCDTFVYKEKLSPSGPKITINDEKVLEVNSGGTLLSTLGNEKIFLPSACGGGGTCIQCTCVVLEGRRSIAHRNPSLYKKRTARRRPFELSGSRKTRYEYPYSEEVFGIKKWKPWYENYNVVSFIKESVVEIPEDMDYKAGGYIQIEIPPCEIKYSDMDITAHPDEHDVPDKFKKNGINSNSGRW